jgi:hypothetical protein
MAKAHSQVMADRLVAAGWTLVHVFREGDDAEPCEYYFEWHRDEAPPSLRADGQPEDSIPVDSSRIFKAVVWVGSEPGEHTDVRASDVVEARAKLKERFGSEAVISVWNEDDANKAR